MFQGTSTERFLYSHVDTVCHFTHISSDSSTLHFESYSAWGKFYQFADTSYSRVEFSGIRPVID